MFYFYLLVQLNHNCVTLVIISPSHDSPFPVRAVSDDHEDALIARILVHSRYAAHACTADKAVIV